MAATYVCSLCDLDTVSVTVVATAAGAVEVSGCMQCDRARCRACSRPHGTLLVPVDAPGRCEHCGVRS